MCGQSAALRHWQGVVVVTRDNTHSIHLKTMSDKRSWRSSVGILQNGQSWDSFHRDIKPAPPSTAMVNAGIVAFVATVFFVISFTSPYWLQSYSYTYSDFNNMGLWEFCFNGFRYPKYQYDHKFMGCNYIFSEEYRIIWSWMLPAWFMAVQTFMTIALLASMTTLVTVSLILIRWPMQMIMRYEWHLTGFCFLCQAITVVAIFFAVLVFGVMCWSRDWLLNPNFNYLSWSYAFAVLAGGFHAFSGFALLHETFEARERKRQATNLLQLDPQGQIGMGSMGMGMVSQGYI